MSEPSPGQVCVDAVLVIGPAGSEAVADRSSQTGCIPGASTDIQTEEGTQMEPRTLKEQTPTGP